MLIRIGEEDIVFLASPDLLKERIPDWDESRKTLTRKELSMIPLTASSNISIMAQNLHRTMLKAGFESKYIFKIEDNNARWQFVNLERQPCSARKTS